MAMPALKYDVENSVEERVAVLEANIEHIRSDISDMKTDIRRLNDKVDAVDQKLTQKIDAVDQKLSQKIDAVDQRLTEKIDAVDRRLTQKIDAVDQKLTEKIDAVDQKLTEKIDAVDQKLTGKIDALKDTVAALALTMEKSFGTLKVARIMDRVWWLLMSAALLGVMGRAFEWI
jgi:prefoldin subunit 5